MSSTHGDPEWLQELAPLQRPFEKEAKKRRARPKSKLAAAPGLPAKPATRKRSFTAAPAKARTAMPPPATPARASTATAAAAAVPRRRDRSSDSGHSAAHAAAAAPAPTAPPALRQDDRRQVRAQKPGPDRHFLGARDGPPRLVHGPLPPPPAGLHHSAGSHAAHTARAAPGAPSGKSEDAPRAQTRKRTRAATGETQKDETYRLFVGRRAASPHVFGTEGPWSSENLAWIEGTSVAEVEAKRRRFWQ